MFMLQSCFGQEMLPGLKSSGLQMNHELFTATVLVIFGTGCIYLTMLTKNPPKLLEPSLHTFLESYFHSPPTTPGS